MAEAYIHLIELPIGSLTYFFTDDGNDFVYNGNNYQAGFIDSIPDITQSSKILENTASFDFYDLDKGLLSDILSKTWRGQKLTLTRVFLNPDFSVNIAQQLYKESLYDFEFSSEDDTTKLTLKCKDIGATEAIRGRKTNSASQHQIDPTDDCFEFTPYIQPNQPWGREGNPTQFGDTEKDDPRYPDVPRPGEDLP